RCIPASLNFDEPNPQIHFEQSPFYVNARLAEWPAGPTPRRAAVGSFGVGGTNAYVILEEDFVTPNIEPGRGAHLIVVSGRTPVAQVALFIVEYALARLWMEWGVRPHAMIGHSVGEYVAATLADVLSLDDALVLVATRGRLMQAVAPGAMLVVALPERTIENMIDSRLSIAPVNAPALTVVSGALPLIEALEAELNARGAAHRRLHTSHAFHSAMMEEVLAPFAD